MFTLKGWHKATLVYIGTVIGAAFASGQEIYRFFVVYGRSSIYGIILSGFLFGLIVACVLCKTHIKQINNADEYYTDITGHKFTSVLNTIISLFMFSSFCIMIAGSGALFNEQLGLPTYTGIIAMSVLCAFIFIKDISGIVVLNTLFTPLMIAGIFFFGIYLLITNKTEPLFFEAGTFNNRLCSTMVYVSYNTLTTVPVMSALNKLINKKSDAIKAGIACGATLLILSSIVWIALFTNNNCTAQLPILSAIYNLSPIANALYIPILYIAMVTTAVSDGFGIIKTIKSKRNIKTGFLTIIICTLGALISFSGFSQLVGKLYSFFGVIGLGVLAVVIIDGIKYLFIGKRQ
ncbi:MAG: hypothetical protein GX800_12760 [Clostridiaceae bacterium]|nr:hypothetical protein [Clostridiaceae bacterium]